MCCLAVVEVSREIIGVILDVLGAIRNILDASVPSKPTSWRIEIMNQFPDVDQHILFTETGSNTLRLYVDFTNGGFSSFTGYISEIGGWILDLLDVNLAEITVDNIVVPSTVVRKDQNNSALSIINEGQAADEHTLITASIEGVVELDIQATCGAYHYPDKAGCIEYDPSTGECEFQGFNESPYISYPEYYLIEIISMPTIDKISWISDIEVPSIIGLQAGWLVEGKGFSTSVDTFVGNYNDLYDFLGNYNCAVKRTHNSFLLIDDCLLSGGAPFRFTMALKDIFGNERWVPTIFMPPKPEADLKITRLSPSSGGYIGDIVSIRAANIQDSRAEDAQVFEDITLTFDAGSDLFTVNPFKREHHGGVGADELFFYIPDQMREHMGETILIRLDVRVSDGIIGGGETSDMVFFELRRSESAEWGDHDLIAFYDSYSYMRTAAVGDLDGDGENDLVIGVPEHRVAGRTIGAVFIIFGPIEGSSLSSEPSAIDLYDASLDRNWDVVIFGDLDDFDVGGNSRRIGNALAVGDFNGDGISDLLLGTTDRNDHDQHMNNIILEARAPTHRPGKAYVFYGRSRDLWQAHNGVFYIHREDLFSGEVQEDSDIIIRGDNQRELGWQVAAGNLNNDRYADMIISSPSIDPDSVTSENFLSATDTVYVIFGAEFLPSYIEMPFGWASTQNGGAMIMQETEAADSLRGDGLGRSLAVGDIDGDGVDDLLIAAPEYRDDTIQGAAYLFYGGRAAFKGNLRVGVTGNQDVMFKGAIKGPLRIGDLNNDGKGEVISSMQARCSIAVWDGAFMPPNDALIDLSELHAVNPQFFPYSLCVHGAELSRLGASITTADLNGDGIQDLVAGAPGDFGSTLPGYVWALHGSDSPSFLKRFGVTEYEHLDYDQLPNDISLIVRHWESYGEGSLPINDTFIYGDQGHDWNQGFGTFVTAGDLSPYVGDDLLIIDPLADAPNPPSMTGLREYAGMLYIFYEGSDHVRPLPFISIKPSTLDFGEVAIGSGASKVIYIKNEGNAILTVDSITCSCDDAFVIQSPIMPFEIEPFEDQMVILEFYPLAFKTYSGTITIHSNAPNEPVARVTIQGAGILESIIPGDEYSGALYENDEVIYYFDPRQDGGVVSLNLNEVDGDIVTDENPPIKVTLLDEYGGVIAECIGGFLNILFPEQGTYTLKLLSEIADPINYQFTLNISKPEPLVISPSSVTLNTCQSEQAFTVSGGIWPYNFELIGADLPTSLGLKDIDSCNGTVILKNNECVSDGLSVTLRVLDGSEAEAEANIFFGGTQTLPFTSPYYAYAEVFSERGYVESDGVAYPGPDGTYSIDTRQGSSATSIGHGYRWWCYNEEEDCCDCNLPAIFNFPGEHEIFEPECDPCTNPYIGWKASWAGVVADPEAERISILVGAANDGGPTSPYCVHLGSSEVCYPVTSTWGYGKGFGYCRYVFAVQSEGALQPGDLVDIEVNFTIEGSGVSGMALLTNSQRVHWLEGQEYLTWDEALEIATPDYTASSALAPGMGTVMPGITAQVTVGDIMVLEALFKGDLSLKNPGSSGNDEQWISTEPLALKSSFFSATTEAVEQMVTEHGNQLTFRVDAQTPGVIIEDYIFKNIDVFEQNQNQPVDIIFTLDNSGSMADDNALLEQNFSSFFNRLYTYSTDFHIAVVVQDDGCILGPDTFIDNTFYLSDAESAFQIMANMHSTGGESGMYTECGFSLAEAALANIGPGECNEGLYREDAILYLINISDDPEQSTSPYTYYVEQFQSMKDDPIDVIINAVAGDYPGGCGTAAPGTGYYEATVATGGLFLSICDSTWGEQIAQDIGSYGDLNNSFNLTQIPVPQTIEVRIDDIVKNSGWHYEMKTNAVVFDSDNVPSRGSTIKVEYLVSPGFIK